MLLEAILAYLHLAAVLTWVVFLTSQAALCRTEWLNPTVVTRLVRVDRLAWIGLLAVLATGLARLVWGAKGAGWYGGNWLLHAKVTGWVVVALMALGPTRSYRRWQRALNASGALPPAGEVQAVRRLVMVEAHVMLLIPLAGVFLARGYGA